MLETVFGWAIGTVLLASAALTLARIVRGPSVLDRIVGTEVLVSTLVCALGAHVALRPGSTTLPLLISLSLVGFVASVAVARFVARDRDYPVTEPPIESGFIEENNERSRPPGGGRK